MNERDLADSTWEQLTEAERATLTRYVQRRLEAPMLRGLVEQGTFTVTVGEMHTWTTDPEGLYDDDPAAVGYVYSVDRDAGTFGVSNGAPVEPDPAFPALLYRYAVLRGAQPPVRDWWGKS